MDSEINDCCTMLSEWKKERNNMWLAICKQMVMCGGDHPEFGYQKGNMYIWETDLGCELFDNSCHLILCMSGCGIVVV